MADVTLNLKPKDVLLRQGEKSNDLYWVLSGKLLVTKRVNSDVVIELGEIHEGQLVGELAFLDNEERSATVTALTKCQIAKISREDFNHILDDQPKWIKKILLTLTRRVREATSF